jgi:ubiquinone/menaquinone biosynthesis C-methylase UbiE
VHAETVATYDRMAPSFAARWWSTRLSSHMERFSSAVTAGGSVVDLGCGPGRDTAWLAELGFSAVGIDASSGMLTGARQRVPSMAAVRGDLVALPVATGSVDGAWMCASMLHLDVDDARRALAEAHRVLRAGGALLVSVQEGSGSTTRSSSEGPRRFTFWDADSLAALVGRCGFVVDVVDAAGPDASSGVSWVAVHASAAA